MNLKVIETALVELFNENVHFEIEPLTIEAQLTVIYGILTQDLDSNGPKKILEGGN